MDNKNFRCSLRLFTVLTLLLCTGCALPPLPIEFLQHTAAKTAADVQPPLPEQAQQPNPLRECLKTDHWREQDLWPDPLSGLRPIESLKQKPAPRWQHVGFMSQVGVTLSATQQQQLRGLAEEDSLAGWNACVLLCWRSSTPVESHILKRVQELTLHTADYVEESGIRFHKQMEPTPATENLTDKKTTRWLPELWPAGLPAFFDTQQTEQTPPVAEKTTVAKSSKTISDALRAAAAEAWCYQLSLLPGDPEQNFSEAGFALQQNELPESVRWGMVRGIARSIPPRQIPLIESLFNTPAYGPTPAGHLAALDACITYALTHPQTRDSDLQTSASVDNNPSLLQFTPEKLDPLQLWPVALWQDRWAETPEIVNRFGLWLALTKHPLAESYLKQGLQHTEPQVQWQAMRNLGLLNSPAIERDLLLLARQREGTPRAIAVLAAGFRRPETVYHFRHDPSLTVRCAVVRFAGEEADSQARQLLVELMSDPDPAVQSEAIHAVTDWEDATAFPVLSAGFLSPVTATRKLSRLKLEQRFEIVLASAEDTVAQRQQILHSIATSEQFPLDEKFSLLITSEVKKTETSPTATQTQRQRVSPEEQQQWQQLVTQSSDPVSPPLLLQSARQQLKSLHEKSPQLLDDDLQKLSGLEQHQRIVLYADLGFEICQSLRDLKQTDVNLRRQAARKLESTAVEKTIPEWGLRIVAEQLQQEQDLHVCRHLLQAVAADTTPAARNVATAALLHSWPDVRVLGCRYAARHRLPQLAPFLLPLLNERNQMVQLAAVEAAGLCQNPLVIAGFSESTRSESTSDAGGLRSLLGAVSPEIERQVILSLARLGDQQGLAEIRKLCHSPQPEARRQALMALTELGGEQTCELLIRLGWTERHPAVQQTILDSLQQLVHEDDRPNLTNAFTYEQKLQIWSAWAEQPR